MRRSFLSFDTDRIKEYVFATGLLKEIRGASGILDELNRKEMERIIKRVDSSAKSVYANGGSGMFEIDESKAADCINAVERLYSTRTVTGSVSGVAKVKNGKKFRDIFKMINYELRMVKDAKNVTIKPVTHPFLRTCDSCGNEYAMCRGNDDEVICTSCKNKRKKDKEIKNNIENILSGRRVIPVEERFEIWDRLLPKLMKDKPYTDKERPGEFKHIGELSSPRDYMGLIYADGDNMGDKLEELDFKEDAELFSDTVDKAIFQAVLKGIKKHLQPKTGDKYFPFDILLLGGDDLVMVTTADKAIETAMTIINAFDRITKCYAMKRFGKPLTLSAGVAIAHAKFPFGNLLNMSEDLLKFAKKMRNKNIPGVSEENRNKGLINFQVVNASSSLSFSEDYKKLFKYEEDSLPKNRKFVRTLRPYDTHTLKNLRTEIQKLKQNSFPRNKIQALREAAFLDYNNSILDGLSVFSRLKTDQRQALTDILGFVRGTGNDPGEMIVWSEKEDVYYTPFLDVAELYNFI
ncbi:MAG: type III-B CRISPR-associated protein Cas10/Cmr2 [Desulfobacterales bacterium]|nr:type III-B CRISPR-associated protein Cas10/Cmr2 [Desulfobacterales bacterium]